MVAPFAMLETVGVTEIEASVAALTVSAAVAVFPAKAAPMVTLPWINEVAVPQVLAALLMVATEVPSELQVTRLVISWVVPSE